MKEKKEKRGRNRKRQRKRQVKEKGKEKRGRGKGKWKRKNGKGKKGKKKGKKGKEGRSFCPFCLSQVNFFLDVKLETNFLVEKTNIARTCKHRLSVIFREKSYVYLLDSKNTLWASQRTKLTTLAWPKSISDDNSRSSSTIYCKFC